MTDTLVTLRLPDSLVSELKASIKEEHYLDLSELIRSVLRKKFEDSASNPTVLSNAIVRDIKKETLKRSEERLAEELRNIQKKLREELQ